MLGKVKGKEIVIVELTVLYAVIMVFWISSGIERSKMQKKLDKIINKLEVIENAR